MKSRIFACIATVAMSATMCFAFTACNGNGGDGSVTDEESWIQAFEDTLASDNLHFIRKSSESGMIYDRNNNVWREGDRVETSETAVDGEKCVGYSKWEIVTEYHDEDPEPSFSGDNIALENNVRESYIELYGADLIRYERNDRVYGTLDWHTYTEHRDSEGEAKQAFSSLSNTWITDEKYNGAGEYGKVYGALPEIYKLFSYDKISRVYSATLIYSQNETQVEVAFRGGKLYRITQKWVESVGDKTSTVKIERTLTYGVTLTVPEDIKNSAIVMD